MAAVANTEPASTTHGEIVKPTASMPYATTPIVASQQVIVAATTSARFMSGEGYQTLNRAGA
jgi:hypothetical protein